jgi:hypothetical protein
VRRVARVVEHLSVVEADPIERGDRAEVDVVREALAAELPELLEELRGGDDGRARVEDEAVALADVGATAGSVELLEDGDAVSARAQADVMTVSSSFGRGMPLGGISPARSLATMRAQPSRSEAREEALVKPAMFRPPEEVRSL